MLKYTSGKFLNLKLNTNASLLNEDKCHAILSGGVKTIVFSADAANEKLYSKLRVNGSLKKVIKNIELFQNIRKKNYSKNPIISRVSGVKFSEEQNFEEMKKKHEIVEPTAINIHWAIHKKVPNANCILHVHSKYATALSCLKDPTLPPIDQNTMRFYNRVAVYGDFGWLGFEEESE